MATRVLACVLLIEVLVANVPAAKSDIPDWLVTPVRTPATAVATEDGKELVLSNGLIRRAFRLRPNAATVAYDNLMTGASILRGIKPEAVVEIDGRRFDVGGLAGQVEYGYLRPEWIDSFTADANAFQFVDYQVGRTRARFPWKRKRYSEDLPWPPPGISLRLRFKAPTDQLPGVSITAEGNSLAIALTSALSPKHTGKR